MRCSIGLLVFVLNLFASTRLEAQEQVKVGLMAELSGPFSAIGEDCRRGWEIAQAEKLPKLSPRPEIIIGDHQRDPKTALSELRRLLDGRGIVGLVFNASPVGLTLNPVSAMRGLPILGTVSHPKFIEGNPFAWRFWTSAIDEGNKLVAYVQAAGLKRMAILTLEDDYTVAVSDAFIASAQSHGIQIVFNERALKSDTEYSTLATRIQAKAPDVIFINIVGDNLATVMRRFRELKLHQKIFTSFSLGKPEIRNAAGNEAIEGASFVEIDGEKPWLSAQMQKRYKADHVTSLNYGCFLSLWTMLTAFERNPLIASSTELQTELAKLESVETPDEVVRIVNREAKLGMLLRTVRGGELVTSR